MQLNLLFFSVLRDLTETEELTFHWALPPGPPTVRALLETLYERYPALRPWDSALLVAVDLEYADRDLVLKDGQEVAIMPPVQGG